MVLFGRQYNSFTEYQNKGLNDDTR